MGGESQRQVLSFCSVIVFSPSHAAPSPPHSHPQAKNWSLPVSALPVKNFTAKNLSLPDPAVKLNRWNRTMTYKSQALNRTLVAKKASLNASLVAKGA